MRAYLEDLGPPGNVHAPTGKGQGANGSSGWAAADDFDVIISQARRARREAAVAALEDDLASVAARIAAVAARHRAEGRRWGR